VGDTPPFGLAHTTADAIADVTHAQNLSYNSVGAHASKSPTTNSERFCSITITPNMVMKQLKSAANTVTGEDDLSFNANAHEDKTLGPWSYDNIAPRQNLWAIVTTSDPGHDQLAPEHKVRFRCERINTWRDLHANNVRAEA